MAERADFNFVEDPSTTKIDEFFFSTFYGGSNSTWSPTKVRFACLCAKCNGIVASWMNTETRCRMIFFSLNNIFLQPFAAKCHLMSKVFAFNIQVFVRLNRSTACFLQPFAAKCHLMRKVFAVNYLIYLCKFLFE